MLALTARLNKGNLMPARRFLACAALLALTCQAPVAADPPDEPALRQRADELERLIGSLEKELVHVRRQLARLPARRGVTPEQAVEQFQRFPKEPVTVEFGVEPVGYPDAPARLGEDPEPAISARWDNRLLGGGTLTAIVPPAVYRKLKVPGAAAGAAPPTPGAERAQVVKHIETHGIRVTGVLEPGGFKNEDYVIQVSDPGDVVLYIKGSGQ
jgi:hypothetical protein